MFLTPRKIFFTPAPDATSGHRVVVRNASTNEVLAETLTVDGPDANGIIAVDIDANNLRTPAGLLVYATVNGVNGDGDGPTIDTETYQTVQTLETPGEIAQVGLID